MHGKAFFIVGHKNWGKSKTLKALSGGRLLRCFSIDSKQFFFRRMSNDDRPDEFFQALRDLLKSPDKPLVIIALCPTFNDPTKRQQLIKALRGFSRGYRLFFFVLRFAYHGSRSIKDTELRNLEKFGTVKVLTQSKTGQGKRAQAFKSFIMQNL